MRHTLLPLNERIYLRREYYRRVTIVFCFTLSLAILVGIAALFPIFIRAISLQNESEQASKSIVNQSEDKSLKEMQKSVARSLALLSSLQKDSNSPKISDLITEVLDIRNGLIITNFSISKVSTTTYSMNIQGTASSRNTLLTFKKDFEDLLPGNKVDLPVSALAKATNFQFSVQLKGKLQ